MCGGVRGEGGVGALCGFFIIPIILTDLSQNACTFPSLNHQPSTLICG